MTRQLWLADKLRAYGLTVLPVPGWQDRGRPGPFDPIGVLVHHTAAPDRTKDAPSLNVCVEGRTGLPGPLCQILVARSGKVYVISANRCNHAGEGGPIGPIGNDKGNTQLVGIELENDGVNEPHPAAQMRAAERATAAVLDHLSRPASNCWGHKEYAPGRKPDPRFDMPQFRAEVLDLLNPKDSTVPPPTRTDYARQIQEALIANGATTLVPDDKLGPATVAATKAVLTFLNAEVAKWTKANLATAENAAAHAAQDAATITKLRAEAELGQHAYDELQAKREAAEAEAAQLRQQLQQGGRLPQLLADLDTASKDLDRAANAIAEAITKARA